MPVIEMKLGGVTVVMEGIQHNAAARTVNCRFVTNALARETQLPARDCLFLLSDFHGMASYVRRHIGENVPHDIEDSPTFVTYDLGFKLQALAGQLEGWNDGSFNIRWMFYCGPADRSQAGYYAGVESDVTVSDALRWCDEMEAVGK